MTLISALFVIWSVVSFVFEVPSGALADAYAKVMGRAGTAGILAVTAATLLATPAFAAGCYRLVGIASIATITLGGLHALRLPDADRTSGVDLTLTFLRSKRNQTQRISRTGPVALGLPSISSQGSAL